LGDTRNLGDPAVSAIRTVVGEATIQITLARRGGADTWGRHEQPSTGRYRQTKETKCGGTGGGKSEQLVVCAGQRMNQEGSSPSGARMRGVVSKSGSNASLAREGGRYGET